MTTYDRNIASRLVNDLMRDFGLTRAQASGVAGNLAYESGGFKTLQERGYQRYGKNARGGYGYAQWTGPRRREFESWARKNNLDPASYEANYGFVKHELENKEKGALNKIKNTKTAQEAALATRRYYERPGVHADSKRIAMSEHIFENAAAPATQIADAALPTPTARPSFDRGGFLNPDQAGSLSFVNSAAAGTMPKMDMPSLASQYSQYQPARDVVSTAAYVDRLNDKVASNPLSQLPTPTTPSLPQLPSSAPSVNPQPQLTQTAFNGRFAGLPQTPAPRPASPIAPSFPQLPSTPPPINQPQGTPLAAGYQQMAQSLDAAGLPNIGATTPVPGAPPPASVMPPVTPLAMQQPVQPQLPAVQAMPPAQSFKQPSAPRAPQAPSMPSAQDVWSGKANYGIATGGQHVYQGMDGGTYRYSPEYDHTVKIGPDGQAVGGPMKGQVSDMGGHFSLHSKLSDKNKGRIGAVAGGALGGLAAGPLGAIIASRVGRNLMTGQPAFRNPFNRQPMTPQQYANKYGVAVNMFPSAPAPAPQRSSDGWSRQDATDRFGSTIADTAYSGKGGLF